MNENRRTIGHQHQLAASSIQAVSMPLGMWAGNGSWASMGVDAQDRAGRRALDELDAALAEMAEVRKSLAAELDSA